MKKHLALVERASLRVLAGVVVVWVLAGSVAAITVSLPELTDVALGSTFCAPIAVGDVTGEGVLSFAGEISWDPATLELIDPFFDRSGGLAGAASWSAALDTSVPGRLGIAAYGTTELAGAGDLGCLEFRVVGTAGSWSVLRFVEFEFNEGYPEASTQNGRVDLVDGSGCLRVSVPACSTAVRREVEIPVVIEDPTDGLGIRSFQTRVTWVPSLVDYDWSLGPTVELHASGPADPAYWVIAADTTLSGELGVVGWDASGTHPMVGADTLFVFRLRGGPVGGETAVVFDYTFLLNEGDPCTIPTDGSIQVPIHFRSWGDVKALYR